MLYCAQCNNPLLYNDTRSQAYDYNNNPICQSCKEELDKDEEFEKAQETIGHSFFEID